MPVGVELVLPPIAPLLDDGGPLDILPSFCIKVALSTTPAVDAVDGQVLILLLIISSRSLLGLVKGRLFLPDEFKNGEGKILVLPLNELKKLKDS